MDWTPVVAALAGGGIGVVAEIAGRLGARRQASEDRKAHLDEQNQRHDLEAREAVQRELRAASRAAAQKIVETLLHNAFPLIDVSGEPLSKDELVNRLVRIYRAIYLHGIALEEPELRRRLILCQEALDLATTPVIDTKVPLREIGVTVRNNMHEWIGQYLRDRPLEEFNEDWKALEARLPDWELQWKRWVEAHGYTVRTSF
jgi:hypothetical protein